ncbi:MAG: YqgE/AlgH family protein [Candidatus Lightella neohaematopini]|nr:YqgE/AlgH family protein [Candidatus Lightella neohaematopini]
MNLQHHFLVAMPTLTDPLFKGSVVYICEHNCEGAMGIIINKPVVYFTIENILDKLKIKPKISDNSSFKLDNPVFVGGPIADDRGFILHTPCSKFNSSISISSQTMITTSKDILETLGTDNQPDNILVALGYSSWGQDQLEHELLDNSWLITPANIEILFHTPIIHRWRNAAKIIGIDIYNISSQIGHG